MKPFLDEKFLLHTATAEKLFYEVANELPIIDFHNHLNAQHLAENKKFDNITQLWIDPDPYKQRAMRINGVPEDQITGNVPDKQKFLNWAATIPHSLGNPLFHWTQLELQRIFGIRKLLIPDHAEQIWQECNEKLQDPNFRAVNLLEKFNPEALCTSDFITDDLNYHRKFQNRTQKSFTMLPSLRGDSMLAFDNVNFLSWLENLSTGIKNLEDYQSVLIKKLDFFDLNGCLLADHALDAGFTFEQVNLGEASAIFQRLMDRKALTDSEKIQLHSYILAFLGKEYHERGWVMQLHVGAQRQTSTRLRNLAGSAGGYACIGTSCDINSLVTLLDSLDKEGALPRVVLYTLNPNDNEAFGSITGSFSEDGRPGKVQFGPAWWFNDHLPGIKNHLKILANYGLLSRFIGFTTDSRSILSFSRHEYFRRILCNLLGEWIEFGELPNDFELITQIIKNICYQNSKNWIIKKNKYEVT